MATKMLTGVDLNNQRGRAFADPSVSTDAATKQYVDALIEGLRWKNPARAATTTNGTLASAFASGQIIDGVTLTTGDRILIKDQTTQTENGIYVVTAGTPTRATDADSTGELNAATLMVLEGTVNADKQFTQTTDDPTVGTSNILFIEKGGGSSVSTDGQGIELSGSTLSLELDGTSLSKSATGLRIGSAAAASGLTESSGLLSVGAGTGITVNADDVAINASVVVRKFATRIGDGATTAFTVTHNLNTQDVTVEIYETASPFNQVFADVQHDGVNTIGVNFATAPTASQYRVVVHG